MRYFFHIFKYNDSKILQSKTPTQVANREGLSTNHGFSFVPSMIDAFLGKPGCFFLPNTGRQGNREGGTGYNEPGDHGL